MPNLSAIFPNTAEAIPATPKANVLATGWLTLTSASAQDRIHYTGTELSNPTYHDGQLSPVVGVHNIQLVRANREHPDASNGGGWTYNHLSLIHI